jgi:hypothetical protein
MEETTQLDGRPSTNHFVKVNQDAWAWMLPLSAIAIRTFGYHFIGQTHALWELLLLLPHLPLVSISLH